MWRGGGGGRLTVTHPHWSTKIILVSNFLDVRASMRRLSDDLSIAITLCISRIVVKSIRDPLERDKFLKDDSFEIVNNIFTFNLRFRTEVHIRKHIRIFDIYS